MTMSGSQDGCTCRHFSDLRRHFPSPGGSEGGGQSPGSMLQVSVHALFGYNSEKN